MCTVQVQLPESTLKTDWMAYVRAGSTSSYSYKVGNRQQIPIHLLAEGENDLKGSGGYR